MVVLHKVLELVLGDVGLDHLDVGGDVLDHKVQPVPTPPELQLEVVELLQGLLLELADKAVVSGLELLKQSVDLVIPFAELFSLVFSVHCYPRLLSLHRVQRFGDVVLEVVDVCHKALQLLLPASLGSLNVDHLNTQAH